MKQKTAYTKLCYIIGALTLLGSSSEVSFSLNRTSTANTAETTRQLSDSLERFAEKRMRGERITPFEQDSLRELIESRTVVPKKKGILAGFGKSSNLTEGLFSVYGQYFREYFYSLTCLINEFLQEIDQLRTLVGQLGTKKTTKIDPNVEKSIANLKSLFSEMEVFCSHLIYFNRKDLDKSFSKLEKLLKNPISFIVLSEVFDRESAPGPETKDTLQYGELQSQISTYFEELKQSILSLYTAFWGGQALDSEHEISNAIIKDLQECVEKAKKHNKMLAQMKKKKSKIEKKRSAQLSERTTFVSKEGEIKAKAQEIRISMMKISILAKKIKELSSDQSKKRYQQTVREDTKKSISNSEVVLEKLIGTTEKLTRELGSISVEENTNFDENEEDELSRLVENPNFDGFSQELGDTD